MHLFKNLPIGTKLLIVLLLVSILPLFIITCGYYTLGKTKLTEQTINVLRVQAENAAASINRYVDYKSEQLLQVAHIRQAMHNLYHLKERQIMPYQTTCSL